MTIASWREISDLLIAVVLIAVTLPLMVIVALAIKLDSLGPVLEKWETMGTHKIKLLKFRTESPTLEGASLLDAYRQPAAAHQCAVSAT